MIADREDIELVRKPITDEGKTGRNFDREGIHQVTSIAERGEIEYMLIDDVDRIGRHAAETIFYLYELREECDVTTVTASSGELDVSTFEGLVQAMLKSLSSQLANENRARRAHAASIKRFKQKDWSVFYNSAPLGYRMTDADWLEVDKSQAEDVQEIFDIFLAMDIQGAYAETAQRADCLSDNADSSQVKRALSNEVYIGKPGIDTTHPNEDETGGRIYVDDEELQIIDETTFKQV